MARIETKDLIFWSVPAAIAIVAGVFAVRAFRTPDWVPPKDGPDPRLIDPCSPGRYRCRAGKVEVTTGDHADGGAQCLYRPHAPCARSCVTEQVTMAGVDEKFAQEQLCDPPKRPLALLSKTESFLDAPIADAGMCEGDGYVPTDEGFLQCIMRSAADRASMGIVIARATCRAGAVKTIDRIPRLIKREEAAAVWCKRDPIAEIDDAPDASADAADAADATDATDAKADAP